MPQICSFYGITIYIYYDDHPEPHFHAFYGGKEKTVAIRDLRAMDGAIPARAIGTRCRMGGEELGRAP